MAEQVRVWSWHHRWFVPLQEEEISVDIAPSGDVIGFEHRIPEDRAIAASSGQLPLDRDERDGGAGTSGGGGEEPDEKQSRHHAQRVHGLQVGFVELEERAGGHLAFGGAIGRHAA